MRRAALYVALALFGLAGCSSTNAGGSNSPSAATPTRSNSETPGSQGSNLEAPSSSDSSYLALYCAGAFSHVESLAPSYDWSATFHDPIPSACVANWPGGKYRSVDDSSTSALQSGVTAYVDGYNGVSVTGADWNGFDTDAKQLFCEGETDAARTLDTGCRSLVGIPAAGGMATTATTCGAAYSLIGVLQNENIDPNNSSTGNLAAQLISDALSAGDPNVKAAATTLGNRVRTDLTNKAVLALDPILPMEVELYDYCSADGFKSSTVPLPGT